MERKQILAIIPARGESRRIPRKNIIEFAGKPLIYHTIEAAKKSSYITKIVVSTDDKEIEEVCKQIGVEVIRRPPELATDTIKTQEAIIHVYETLKAQKWIPEIMVLLQPTSPLRTAEDIDATIEEIITKGADSAQTVTKVRDHPSLMVTINEKNEITPLLNEGFKRSQDFTEVYIKNGAVYAWTKNVLEEKKDIYGNKHHATIMPYERSIDIDEVDDIPLANYYKERNV